MNKEAGAGGRTVRLAVPPLASPPAGIGRIGAPAACSARSATASTTALPCAQPQSSRNSHTAAPGPSHRKTDSCAAPANVSGHVPVPARVSTGAPAAAASPSRAQANQRDDHMSSMQLSKQEAERHRRETVARQRDELEQLRSLAAKSEAENARLLQQVTIWKNAQTAASSLLEEMEKLRLAHAKTRGELAAQVSENAKLKKEKEGLRNEIRRFRRIAANAERARTHPSVVATAALQLRPDESFGQCVITAQRQLLGALALQRAYRVMQQRRGDGGGSAAVAKFAVAARTRADNAGARMRIAAATAPEHGNPLRGNDNHAKGRTSETRRTHKANERLHLQDITPKFVTSSKTLAFDLDGCFNEQRGSGLEELIGSPCPDVQGAIEREHKDETTFASHTVRRTTPLREYLYVAHMQAGSLPDRRADGSGGRSGWVLDDFVRHDRAREASLIREEVVCLRLYTGPMHVIYNHVMRQGLKRAYVTTLHALNSGVWKLSQHSRACTVYRALSGGSLPTQLSTPGPKGTIGGVEASFTSVSSDRLVALEHARTRRVDSQTRSSLMLHIKVGVRDRAADVEFLSQSPSERELIFAPLTALEVVSKPWIEGTTIVIDVRLWSQPTGYTIEQLTGKMKFSHLALIDLMLRELRNINAPKRALLSLSGLRHESAARGAAEFNIANNYQVATERALAALKDVLACLSEQPAWAEPSEDQSNMMARMLSVAMLQCRAGEYDDARELLLQLVERNLLPAGLNEKLLQAGQGFVDNKGNLPEADRRLILVAMMLLHHGATPPWPPLIVFLMNSLSEYGTKVFGTVLSGIDPSRARPTFPAGAAVLIWDESGQCWLEGTVCGARGRGTYEVHASGESDTVVVPMKHVLRPSDGGVGALLHESGRRGSLHLLESLLKGGISPFECDADGNTALHHAVQRGHVAMCRRLLAAGLDADVPNRMGVSPWDIALQTQHAVLRRIFSPSLADKDLIKLVDSKRGGSSLLLAAQAGDYDAVTQALTDKGCHVDEVWKSGGTTALMLSSRRGDEHIVDALLRASASVEARSRRGSSALSMAAEEGRIGIVQLLLAAGAAVDEPDDDGFTALALACENGHASSARALLSARSDPNLARKNGWTCLITTAYNGYVKVAHELTAFHADTNLSKNNGYNPLIAATYNGFHEMVASLLDAHANADHAMSNGWNSVMVAAAQGHASTLARLCEAGADVDHARPFNGFSPLMASASSIHSATCTNILLQFNANVNLTDKVGCNALMHAAWNGREPAVEVLLQASANVDAVRLGGTTALMDAAAAGHEGVVAKLLRAGARVDAADSHGLTALMHAARAGHDIAMLPLLRAGAAFSAKDRTNISVLAHCSTLEAAQRVLAAGADPKSRKGAMPEPRTRTHTPSVTIPPHIIRMCADNAAGAPGSEAQSPSGPTAKKEGVQASSEMMSAAPKLSKPPASPWAIGVEQHKQKKEGSAAKDVLRVRPIREDSASKQRNQPHSPRSRRRPLPKILTMAGMATEEEEATRRADDAVRKLQSVFKSRFQQRMRAEAKLLGMLKQSRQLLTNHQMAGE